MKTFIVTIPQMFQYGLHRNTHDQNKTDFDLSHSFWFAKVWYFTRIKIDLFYWLQSNQSAGQELWAVIQGK